VHQERHHASSRFPSRRSARQGVTCDLAPPLPGRLGRGTYQGCAAYADFRDLVTRDDIDAVVIASPEFWHALYSVWAMRHGKDVFCEKAMTLTAYENQAEQ
jgi:predicted dehydrogenase